MTSPSPRGQYDVLPQNCSVLARLHAEKIARDIRLGKTPAPVVALPKPVEPEPEPAPEPNRNHEKADRPYSVTSREIIAQEIARAGVTKDDFYSRSRKRHLVHARQMAAYRIHVHTDLSYPLIAKRIGWEDHTTAMHAIKKIEKEMAEKEIAPKNLATLELLAQGGIGPDEIIRQGYRFGVAVKDIARLAGKTKSAVVGKAARMGLRSPVADDPLRYRCRISDGQKERWARQKQREAMTA